MNYQIRDYQQKAFDAVFHEWENHRSTLVVMPTGTGKTILFSPIIQRIFPRRVLVVAHRNELVWQAREKIQAVSGLSVDIEMGEYKSSNQNGLFGKKAPVVVSTVQTLISGGNGGGRIGKFNPNEFGAVIFDEAHHRIAKSWGQVAHYFMRNESLKILGVTATPDRADEESLIGGVFDTLAFRYELLDAINDGWLVYPYQKFVSIDSLDFSNIRTTAGDLNGADLAVVMNAEKNLYGVADATIQIAGDKQGIGFASSVEHARVLSNLFNRHRAGMSAWVCGGTEKEERKQIINDFSNGNIQWIWNCGVLTEGFDNSKVEVISVARPTKSRALYAQMIGRATRPDGSIAHTLNTCFNSSIRRGLISQSKKPSALIIDFVGNSGKHKLISTIDILVGKHTTEEVVELTMRFILRSKRPVKIERTIAEQEEILAKEKKRKLEEEAQKARLLPKAIYKTQDIDLFNETDKRVAQSKKLETLKSLSPKQRSLLLKNGVNPDSVKFDKAKRIIADIFRRYDGDLCSIAQAKILEKFGYELDVSRNDAKKTIDYIAKNGWQLPLKLKQQDSNEPF